MIRACRLRNVSGGLSLYLPGDVVASSFDLLRMRSRFLDPDLTASIIRRLNDGRAATRLLDQAFALTAMPDASRRPASIAPERP